MSMPLLSCRASFASLAMSRCWSAISKVCRSHRSLSTCISLEEPSTSTWQRIASQNGVHDQQPLALGNSLLPIRRICESAVRKGVKMLNSSIGKFRRHRIFRQSQNGAPVAASTRLVSPSLRTAPVSRRLEASRGEREACAPSRGREGTKTGACSPRRIALHWSIDRTACLRTSAFLSLREGFCSSGDQRPAGACLHPNREKEVELAYRMTQQLIHLMKNQQGDSATAWISICSSCGISELEAFALGLQKEFPAFQAACSLPYNNGMAEGFVNKLKHIKGSMYGRGSFGLLRQRVLQSAA